MFLCTLNHHLSLIRMGISQIMKHYQPIFEMPLIIQILSIVHILLTNCNVQLIYLLKFVIQFHKSYHSVIIKRLSGHSPGNRFSMLFVIISHSFIYFQATEKPVEPKFYGYLTFGHKLSYDNKSIFRLYYSMIVATRPDPTVRPPSRYFNPVLSHIFYGFLSKIQ